MSVEVERKFLCNDDTLKTLEAMGAVCVGQREFNDQYFDTPGFDLTLRDMWLRKRKGCWELKCPTTGAVEQSAEAALCSRYMEITDLPDIRLKVGEVIGDGDGGGRGRSPPPPPGDEPWPGQRNLVCFAEFTTVRRSFALEDGVQVDLDQADFGYHVGEIEVLVAAGADVQPALEKIERTAQKLGLSGHQRVEGKMNIYLKRNHPEHYEKLLSKHVL